MVEETAKGEEALVEVKEKEEEEATVADSEEEIQFSLERCTRNLYCRYFGRRQHAPITMSTNIADASKRRDYCSLLSPARQSRICEPKT